MLDAVTEFIVEDALNRSGGGLRQDARGDGSPQSILDASTVWSLAHFGLWREVAVVLLRDENTPMLRKIQAQTDRAIGADARRDHPAGR